MTNKSSDELNWDCSLFNNKVLGRRRRNCATKNVDGVGANVDSAWA